MPPHISLPGIAPRFPSPARIFFAAKRATNLRARRADVDIRDAAIGTTRRQKRFRRFEVAREDRTRQALRHLVIPGDGLIEIIEIDGMQQRSKHFLPHHRHVVPRTRNRRLDKVSVHHLAAVNNFAAFGRNLGDRVLISANSFRID